MSSRLLSRLRASGGIVLCIPICGLILSGCATIGSAPTPPEWWVDPHKHDKQHLYFKAKGESSVSVEDARRQALNSIRGQIAEYVFSEVKVQEVAGASRVSIESAVELREVEAFKEDEARSGSRWIVWMLGRYPRSEYDRIRERLEIGAQLESQWREAQSAVNRQQPAAEGLLLGIVKGYDKALRASFDLEAVKLELAGLYLKQNRGRKARQWITDVQKSTTDPAWRSRADELGANLPPISAKDAFEGGTVALYCCARSDGKIAIDERLTQELNGRLVKDAIRTVALHDLIQTGRDGFDDAAMKHIATACAPRKADAALVILLDIDTTKTGAKIGIPGTSDTTDALDAKLTWFVIRVSDGLVLASDSAVGLSNASAGMLNTILTHRRHLPKHAPAIAEGLGFQ